MQEVELHPAFLFICNECGEETFVRAEPLVEGMIDSEGMDPEEFKEIVKLLGVNGGYTTPEYVTCKYCEAQYKAVDCDDEFDEFDDEDEDNNED